MKKIKLFHSYIYIKNSRNIKNINNKLYDSCNNFILGLLNIPQENELYKILIQKNLIKVFLEVYLIVLNSLSINKKYGYIPSVLRLFELKIG